MADDTDEVGDALTGHLHIALMVGARVGETRARRLEQQHRNAQAASEQVANELRIRLDAERAAARAAFLPSQQPDWLDRAGPAEIGYAWETASAWRNLDPDAGAALDAMRARLIERYGVDPATVTPDAQAVADALAARAEADTERSGAAADTTESAALLGEAELAEHAAAPADAAHAEAAEAASLANACQPTPPTGALAPQRSPAPRTSTPAATLTQTPHVTR